tara:strand:- start:575 stop:1114 length:540 start_codon:yes stop_codon:yes gene_type:complete
MKKGLLLLISIIILSCSKDSTGSGLFRDNLDKTYFIMPQDDPNNPEFVIEFGKNFLLKVYDDDGTCLVWTKEGTFDTDMGDGVKMSVKNEIIFEEENTYQIKITSDYTGYASGDFTEYTELGFSYGEIDDDGNVTEMLWFPSFFDSENGVQYVKASDLSQIMTLPAVAQSSCNENEPFN